MIVAFLDLLGFSYLLKTDQKVALNNLNHFNNDLLRRESDDQKMDESDGDSVAKLRETSSISSFLYMISFSDSLVLGSDQPDLFVKQLSGYLADLYIEFSEPFINPFKDINEVHSLKDTTSLREGSRVEVKSDRAFPLLFRGGISYGKDVDFYQEYHIYEKTLKRNSLSVSGLTYLEAVELEKAGKGPRLFCNKEVVDKISDKAIIREVDAKKDIYEIIWTVQACEKLEHSKGIAAVHNSIYGTLLLPALNLYKYYKDKEVKDQYLELVKLVCRGSLIYARKKSDQEYREVFNALSKILADYYIKNILEI